MNLARLRCGWLCLLLSGLPLVGAVPSRRRRCGGGLRVEVRHIGPPAVSDDLVRAHIRVRPGDTYSRRPPQPMSGRSSRPVISGTCGWRRNRRRVGYRLIYILQGKPVLTEIRFEGNTKYSRRKLLKKVDSKIGQPLDDYKLLPGAQEIQKMYQKAGYHRTTGCRTVAINEALGRATAVFVMEESPKIRITDVEFVGAEAFAEKRLRRVIKTRRWWMFSWLTGSGKLKDEQFEDDKFKLLEFYQDEGYIDFD
jgi:outer membrane protein insertion porin family